MLRVFKYAVPVTDYFYIDLPRGAELLTAQVQAGEPQLWARVDDDAPTEQRHFRLVGTGHPAADTGKHVGSFQMHGGGLVFHLFEARG